MNPSRRRSLGTMSLAVLLASASLAGFAPTAAAHAYDDDGLRSGFVFTSSNDQAGNEVFVYARGERSELRFFANFSTGGQGSGAGLGSQGAVTLSGDREYLFVVNALSNTVSTFKLRERTLQLVSVVSSGGVHPISVTEHDDLVYVLNDGGAGNVAGFRNERGTLKPIGGSARGLSASGGTAPAQVGFSDDGEALVVTEKATSKLTSYRVRDNGSLFTTPIVTTSPGLTPFGFAFNRRNQLLVTEAVASGVSSYRFRDADPARPVVVSASVLDTQRAACWIAITPNGRYAYVANAGTSTVSSYRIATGGQIELLSAVAGGMPAGSGPTDTAVSSNGRNLYVLDGRTFSIAAFSIDSDGTLAEQTGVTGLPQHVVGLAAN